MTKYKAKKVTVDNIHFDSKSEADYYSFLKELEKKGFISDIKLQPKFLLQPKFIKNNKKYRDMYYVADFSFEVKGQTIVIDVKGLPTETAKLKRKLFDYRYKEIKLVWVKKKSKRWVRV